MTPTQQLANALPRNPEDHGPVAVPSDAIRDVLEPDGATLDELTADVLDTLASFRAMWLAGQKTTPADWPERMGLADWWEQLIEHDRDEAAP